MPKKKQKVAAVLLSKILGVCVCGGGWGGGVVARSHMCEQHPKGEGRASDAELLVARLLRELALRVGFVLLLVANSKRINLTV